MIVLSCKNISKSFGIDVILKDISFSINDGERIGLVGINGSGKSTLFRILSGIYEPDSGEIFVSKQNSIGYLEQTAEFDSESTIYEETLSVFSDLIAEEASLRDLEHEISAEGKNGHTSRLDMLMKDYSARLDEFNKKNGYSYKSEVKGILKGLGFSDEEFDKPAGILSGGEKTRVLLAKLLLKKPEILLLDEPTNHLDINAVEWLETFIKQYFGTVIIISHDRYFLDQTVSSIFELSGTILKKYSGNYSYYVSKKAQEGELEIKQYEEAQSEIRRQKEIAQRLKGYGNEKFVKRARSREKLIEKLEEPEKPFIYSKKAKMHFEAAAQSGRDVLHARSLSMAYESNLLFENLSFDIYRGERVALIGPNGKGKSTLFKILCGKENALSGDFSLGTNVSLGYYDQQQENIDSSKSVIDEIWDSNEGLTQTQVRTYLGAFLFEGDDVFKPISSLSGGEKARISLLKLMLSKSNFLLLDEPTNHLDIDSKEVLEDALLGYDGTIFAISHDRYFLNKIADRIIVLEEGGYSEYLGNYDYYNDKKRMLEEMNAAEESHEKTKTQLRDEKKKQKEKQVEAKRVEKERAALEEEIMDIEESIGELDVLMCSEEVYSNPEKSKEIHLSKSSLESRLASLYERWEELSE